MVLEALSPRNLVVMDMKLGSLTIVLGATEYKRYPRDEKPTKDNTTIGVSWEHGIYLDYTLSTTNFKAYRRENKSNEKARESAEKHPITKAVLAPMKAVKKMFVFMELHLDASIDKNVQLDKEKYMENAKVQKQTEPERA